MFEQRIWSARTRALWYAVSASRTALSHIWVMCRAFCGWSCTGVEGTDGSGTKNLERKKTWSFGFSAVDLVRKPAFVPNMHGGPWMPMVDVHDCVPAAEVDHLVSGDDVLRTQHEVLSHDVSFGLDSIPPPACFHRA